MIVASLFDFRFAFAAILCMLSPIVISFNKMQFMTWERQRAYDLDAGREERHCIGAQQKAVEDARSFYANGASIELISKSLNMTIEQVKEIVRDTAVSV